jgi:RHS repeat-associated protein
VHDEGICEPSSRTTGATLLDFGCWTAKPGTASPPATLPTYISVIVATSIGEVSGRVYGNIAAVVVLQVDTTPAYGPGLNQQGFGTIRAVIEDGAGLFPQNATTAPLSELHEPGTSRVLLAGTIASLHFGGLGLLPGSNQPGSPRRSLWLASDDAREDTFGGLGMTGTESGRGSGGLRPSRVSALVLDPGSRRYSFYSPEMNLLAESELTTAAAPAILYEYVWFNGHPVAQLDGGTLAHWTFTDHLGTPLLQTDSAGAVFWRAEYEPFGSVFALRTADQHQPLRFPGQEAEQFNLGSNGLTDRSYNIFRWYRPSWGRYTQSDPIGLLSEGPVGIGRPRVGQPKLLYIQNLYGYAAENPLSLRDPAGLSCSPTCPDCPKGTWLTYGVSFQFWAGNHGVGHTLMDAKCLSSSMTCTFLVSCYKFGGGLGVSLNAQGGLILHARCADDLEGWSLGAEGDIHDGGGFSWYVGAGPGGDIDVGIGGPGIGLGGGSGAALCVANKLNCRR